MDEVVNVGMLACAQKTFQTAKPGMILINNPWGERNEKGLKAALGAQGVAAAGSTEGDAVRQGFYKIDRFDGLVKTCVKTFAEGRHDAVGPEDVVWAQFIDNRIVLVGMK